jgi:cytochrome b561
LHQGLRVAFYSVLITLPASGLWLALSVETPPAHVLEIPGLPQWFHQEGATPPGRTGSEAYREDSPNPAVVRRLTQLHKSLSVVLAIVVALHLIALIDHQKQRE